MPIQILKPVPHSGGSPDAQSLGTGESRVGYTPDAGFQLLELKAGSVAVPDEVWSPLVHASRVISILENTFPGDGVTGLAAIQGHTHAVSGSEGQAIGVHGSASTDSSHVGAHSQTDAVGVYGLGIATSTAGGNRVGIGGFFNGRRESTTSATTGIEVASDNETLTNGKHTSTGASDTKGIWLHAVGTAGSGTGLQIGFTTRSFEVGIGINQGATSAADFRTDSSAGFSIRIRGTHAEAAISVKQGAGVVLLGSSTETAVEATAILETPFLRINATGINFNGQTPVAIKAGGAETTAAIWARMKELGLTT